MSNPINNERLDSATAARLRRLATRPADTTRLAGVLERAMTGDEATVPPALPAAWRRWWRPITTAAAAVLIAVAVGWLALDGGATPAMAAPAALAQIHYDVANGLAPHLKVSSVEQANQLLADQADGVVAVPHLPGTMMSCCLHQVEGATLTCALIEQDGRLITVAVADGGKLHSPRGRMIERGGRRFMAHTANGINMVMAHEGDRWLCVMGEVDFDDLVDVAVGVRL